RARAVDQHGDALGEAGRHRPSRRNERSAHDGGETGACGPAPREPSATPRAGDSPQSDRAFCQGGHVVAADVALIAAEANASVSAVCRVLETPRSTYYA